MTLFLSLFIILLLSAKTFANPLACAVCTVAIAGGLGISRMLGVDDMVVGVWVGAGMFALAQWTVYYFEKKNINNIFVKALCYIGWYSLIIPLYLGKNPSIVFNLKTVIGIDSFVFSIIIGSSVLFGSAKLYYYMKEKNGGKPHFPFEKVVLPVVSLIITSLIFFLTTRG